MASLMRTIPRTSRVLCNSIPKTPFRRCFQAQPALRSDMAPILTRNAMPPVGPYSQAIKTPHAIYCSGQIPADPQGNIIEGTMSQRTEACIEALSAVLTEAGSSLDKIVKAQIFLTDMKDFAEMNVEYEKWIKHKPARSCVAVRQLPKGVDIEIECIALP
ncbi:YjgF-like protein [Hyaloscypha variabilis]